MFRATGSGKVEIDADFSGIGILGALLYDVDFGDFADMKYRDIKVKHKTSLADKLCRCWMTRRPVFVPSYRADYCRLAR